MAKRVVLRGDAVEGADRHTVTGSDLSVPPLLYAGTGEFAYAGAVTDAVSDFVSVGGVPVALVTSRSSLPAQETAPIGRHAGPQGGDFLPQPPLVPAGPNPVTLSITDLPLGEGAPNAAAGSGVFTVNGARVLLDGDPFDTCGPAKTAAGSTVAATAQTFVSCGT